LSHTWISGDDPKVCKEITEYKNMDSIFQEIKDILHALPEGSIDKNNSKQIIDPLKSVGI
jgi:hypothetical protein